MTLATLARQEHAIWEREVAKGELANIGAEAVDYRTSSQISRERLKMMKRFENERRIHVRERVRIGRPLAMALVSVSSPRHYTLWNALAAESLAGDVRGF